MNAPDDGSWRGRGALFNQAAINYLEGRPGYPAQVFELLRDRCGLRSGTSVLEVGAGAGQATLPLLDAGAHVTAVEPGAELAKVLAARTAGRDVTVVVDRFEDARPPDQSFDLVVSATAFHWVEPEAGFANAGRVLREGGWLALWWTVWGDPAGHDPLHERLRPVLAAKAPHLLDEGLAPGAYALDARARAAEIAASGLFGDVEQHIIRWTGHHTAAQARALFATFSPFLALGEPLCAELLDDVQAIVASEFHDHVERPYVTVLYRAQRVAPPDLAQT